tara:strand:- start:2702 stop:2989 length:288 start_codon:yes stop_codon:yes gene_type:complete
MQRNKDGRSFRDSLAEKLEKLEKFGKKAQRDVDVHVVKEGVCWTLPRLILLTDRALFLRIMPTKGWHSNCKVVSCRQSLVAISGFKLWDWSKRAF